MAKFFYFIGFLITWFIVGGAIMFAPALSNNFHANESLMKLLMGLWYTLPFTFLIYLIQKTPKTGRMFLIHLSIWFVASILISWSR